MENASSLLQATLSRVIHARSPWEVLGVSRDCSVSEARRAYKRDALILHPDKRVMMMIPPGVASSAGSASHGVGGGKIPEDHTLTLKREDAFRRLREALEAFCASSANRSSAAASMYTVVSPPGHPSASATARTAGLGVPGDRGGFDPTRHSWGAGGGGGGPDLLGGGGGWAGGGRWSSYMDEEAENIVPLTMAPRGINRDGWAAASSAAVRSHPPEDPTRKKRRSFADCTVFQRNWGSGVGGGGNGGTVCREGDAADAPPASSRMGPPPSVWAAAPPSSRPTLAMRDGSGGRGHKAREGGPCPRRPAGKAAKPEGRARRAKANALTGLGGDALSNAVGVGSERPADRHTTTAASVSGITEDDNVADDVIVCVSTDGTNEVESDTAGSSSGISSDGISISQEDEGAVGACSSLHNDGSSGPAATRSGPGVCEESWSGDGIGKGPPPHGGGTATAVTRGWGRPRAAPVFTLGGPSSAPSTALLAPPLGENKAFPISRMHASRLSPPDYPPNERPEEAAATSVKLKPCSHPRAEQGGGLCVSPLGRMAAASSGANLPTVDPSDPDLDLVPQDCGGIPGAWWSSGDGIAMEEEDPSAPAGSGPPGQKKAAALPDGKRRVAVTRVTIESLEQHYEALHDEEVPSLRAAQSDGGVLLASGNAGRRRVKAKIREKRTVNAAAAEAVQVPRISSVAATATTSRPWKWRRGVAKNSRTGIGAKSRKDHRRCHQQVPYGSKAAASSIVVSAAVNGANSGGIGGSSTRGNGSKTERKAGGGIVGKEDVRRFFRAL